MSYPMSMELKPKQATTLKQNQCVMMSPQMQQGIHLLQLPVQELAVMIEAEMEQNPLLEYIQEAEMEDERGLELQIEEDVEDAQELELDPEKSITIDEEDFAILQRLDEDYREYFASSGNDFTPRTREDAKKDTFFESLIIAEPTLFDHLMTLAHETFSDEKHLFAAEILIGSLDEHGFLDTPLEEIAQLHGMDINVLQTTLQAIQTFEPVGVGAQNLREALLIQLKYQGKAESLAYKIVHDHFEDLIHNHLPAIQKGLKCKLSEINASLEQDIAKLDLHPAASFSHQSSPTLIPDVTIDLEGESFSARVNEDSLPAFKINPRYLKLLEKNGAGHDDQEFVKHKMFSAKWLLRNIRQRSDTLERIGNALASHQSDFFKNPEGKLTPLTMRMLAEELELHESTIARAVANKYLQSPRGIFPLRYFFSNAYTSAQGDQISSKTVRDQLLDIIAKEDKGHPYSDQALSFQLKMRGLDCARRTIAKYRTECNLGNAQQRRKY